MRQLLHQEEMSDMNESKTAILDGECRTVSSSLVSSFVQERIARSCVFVDNGDEPTPEEADGQKSSAS